MFNLPKNLNRTRLHDDYDHRDMKFLLHNKVKSMKRKEGREKHIIQCGVTV